MADITIQVQNANAQIYLDGVTSLHGYTETIPGPNGDPIPNPETKLQFFKRITRKFWRDCSRAARVRERIKQENLSIEMAEFEAHQQFESDSPPED